MSERDRPAPRISGATRLLEALPEAKRNHLLRRSDWRYLLPDAAPALALCLGGTELWASCEVIAREVHDAPKKGVRYVSQSSPIRERERTITERHDVARITRSRSTIRACRRTAHRCLAWTR